jgi:hypothetical protein
MEWIAMLEEAEAGIDRGDFIEIKPPEDHQRFLEGPSVRPVDTTLCSPCESYALRHVEHRNGSALSDPE